MSTVDKLAQLIVEKSTVLNKKVAESIRDFEKIPVEQQEERTHLASRCRRLSRSQTACRSS